jgi:hypothetical protein
VHEAFNFKEIQATTAVLGQGQVWFAFNFVSDAIVEYEGAYVDNFVLRRSPGENGEVVPGWKPVSSPNPPRAPQLGESRRPVGVLPPRPDEAVMMEAVPNRE